MTKKQLLWFFALAQSVAMLVISAEWKAGNYWLVAGTVLMALYMWVTHDELDL